MLIELIREKDKTIKELESTINVMAETTSVLTKMLNAVVNKTKKKESSGAYEILCSDFGFI